MVEVWSVVCFFTGGFRPIDHERVNLCCAVHMCMVFMLSVR